MARRTAYIRSVGHFLPEKRLTNRDLEQILDTTEEWIVTRTGIRERRILEPGLGNSHMAIRAGRECLERAGVAAADLDVIIVGTVTPDMMFPATACLVQKALGADKAWGFDLSAACSGFIFALTTAAQMIEAGRVEKALVIGSDVMSSIMDYEDRNTCVLFGDGAGAALLEPCREPGHGILDFVQCMDGGGGDLLHMKAGGSLRPASIETVRNKEHYLRQEGKQVFRCAVTGMADVSVKILERNGLSGDDVKLFIPHQANLRIIDASAQRMKLDSSKVIINVDRYANTTAGTVPIALYEAVAQQDRLARGDYLVMSAFGAGFTWGSVLVRWWC